MTARLLPGTSKGKKYQRDFYQAKVAQKKEKKAAQTGDFVMDVGGKKKVVWNPTLGLIMTRDLSTLDIDPCNLNVLSFHLHLLGALKTKAPKR